MYAESAFVMQGHGPPTFPSPAVSAPTFPSPEAKRAFERSEAAREEVHPLDWADDFGPLAYTELTKLVMHMQRIERARDDAAEEHALCVAAGYTDASHFRRVRATFLKYWGSPNGSDVLREFTWKEPEFSQALVGAMQLEREEEARVALQENPELLAPGAAAQSASTAIGSAPGTVPGTAVEQAEPMKAKYEEADPDADLVY